LAALLGGEGVDDKMGWADKAFLQSCRSLNGEQLIYERLVNAATKLAEGLGQDKVALRRIDPILAEATGVHDGKVCA
jgi:hypothetical protein